MTAVSVVIPTVDGREPWLDLALRGFRTRTTRADLDVVVVKNRPTCGVAWRDGLERAEGDYVLLTADDIVPGEGWFEACAEATGQGLLPCPATVRADASICDADSMPLPGNPVGEELPGGERGDAPPVYVWANAEWGEIRDGQYASEWDLDHHPAVPFATREQWDAIGPMIVPQYGGDKWVGWRAREAGIPLVARTAAKFYHYSADVARWPREPGWMWEDRFEFDTGVAFPMYMAGLLDPGEFHPDAYAPRGRDHARALHRLLKPPPYRWERAAQYARDARERGDGESAEAFQAMAS